MILVPCPYCGLRNASEFRWGGEIRTRPDPNGTTKRQWREYLYFKRNAAGWITETWYHQAGCGRHFRCERNTVTNEIRTTYVENEWQPASASARPEQPAQTDSEVPSVTRR
jgi:heterotetrameric sarcosine oxidase delta subunit